MSFIKELFQSPSERKAAEDKAKQAENIKKAQDIINISGFERNNIVTKDNRMVRLMEIETATLELLSPRDKKRLTSKGTEAFRGVKGDYELFVCSQPTDLNEYYDELKSHIAKANSDNIKFLIRSQCNDISRLAANSLSEERKTYLVISTKNNERSEMDLDEKERQYRAAYTEAEYKCVALQQWELTSLLGIISHPSIADKYNENDYLTELSFIVDEKNEDSGEY